MDSKLLMGQLSSECYREVNPDLEMKEKRREKKKMKKKKEKEGQWYGLSELVGVLD